MRAACAAAEAGLLDATLPVSPVRLALPAVRVGQFRMADIGGTGDMAAQNSWAIVVTGGEVDNVVISGATIVGGSIGGNGTRPSIVATINLDVTGAFAFRGPTVDPHVANNLWLGSDGNVKWSSGP